MHLIYYVTLFQYLLIISNALDSCEDKKHFNYFCWQLAKYCNDSHQSAYIRKQCPSTCKLCRSRIDSRLFDDATIHKSRAVLMSPGMVEKISVNTKPFVLIRPISHTTPTTLTTLENDNTLTLVERTLPVQTSAATVELPVLTESKETTDVSSVATDPSEVVFARSQSQSQQEYAAKYAKDHNRIQQCCQQNRLNNACLPLCSYTAVAADIYAKAISGVCTLEDAKLWFSCASGQRDNRECCQHAGIVGCEDLCMGRVPQNLERLMFCFANFLNPILECHRLGFN